MGRKRKGTVERHNGGLRLVVTIDTMREGQRVPHRLRIPVGPKVTEMQARKQAQELTDHFAGRDVDAKQVYAVLRGEPATVIRDFVNRVYLPTREGQKSHRYQEGAWRNHILPVIGDLDVTTFGADDLRALVTQLDAKACDPELKFSQKNATNVWGIVTKFCRDLVTSKVNAVRVRKDNPCESVAAPDRGRRKTLQWLYPNELQQLLACDDVPVHRRRMYALYTYLFCRAGELPALDFAHNVDLRYGMVTIDRKMDPRTKEIDLFTKADGRSANARSFPIEANLIPLLTLIAEERGLSARVIDPDRIVDGAAETLRADLWAAEVRRPALHEQVSADSLPLRLHDLRATGITYLSMRGHTDEEIRDRAGHADFEMTKAYIRRGRLSADQMGEPFQPLPAGLLRKHSLKRRRSPHDIVKKTLIASPDYFTGRDSVMKTSSSIVRRRGLEPPRELPH